VVSANALFLNSPQIWFSYWSYCFFQVMPYNCWLLWVLYPLYFPWQVTLSSVLCYATISIQLNWPITFHCFVLFSLNLYHLLPTLGTGKINFSHTVRIQENNLDSKGLKIGHKSFLIHYMQSCHLTQEVM